MKKTNHFMLCAVLLFSICGAEQATTKKTALFEEIRRGDKQAIRARLENDEDLSEKEEETENNALHIAAENDDPEMIELLTTQPERSFFSLWTYYWIYDQAKLPHKDEENKDGNTPAHCAIEYGNGKATQKLVEKGINLNKKNKKGETLLIGAVKAEKNEITQQLCATNINLDEKDNEGKSAIHYAIENKNSETTQCLAHHGADLNSKDSDGKRPLHYSIIHNIFPLTEYLVEKGADINAQDTHGNTPAHCAIKKDHFQATEYLIEKKANLAIRNQADLSPVFLIVEKEKTAFIHLLVKYQLHTQTRKQSNLAHYAVEHDKLACLAELAVLKDLINRDNKDAKTPAMLAAEKKDISCLKLLHKKGVNLKAASAKGWQPIHNAAYVGNEQAINYLLENGVDVDVKTGDKYNTSLQLAIMQGHLNIVDVCLYFKANINTENIDGDDAFLTAAKYSNPDIINRLKKHPSVNMNARDKNGRTALMNAAINDNQSLVKILIDPNVDIAIIDNEKENVAHKIARIGNISMLNLIFSDSRSKKLLEQANEKGNTPLMVAIGQDNRKTTQLLLDKEVNVHIKNNNYDTPLSFAVENGNAELVQLLTQRYHLPVNIMTKDGRIPLFVAVEKGYQNTTKALLEAGASLLTKNNKNETIIHAATKQPHATILRDLLEQKDRPSLEIIDNTGHTAICWAAYCNNIHHIQLLEQSGANLLYVTPAGNTIAHCAANGKAVETLDYIIKHYPHLRTTPNREGEIPLFSAAKIGSLACAETLLREDDFITKAIDKAISVAQKNNHTTFARSFDQKIKDRKKEREKITQKEKNILTLKAEIQKLDQQINQKSWLHSADFNLSQQLSSIKNHSVEELYNKTDAECDQLFGTYTQMLDAAVTRKHHLVNKLNEILQAEEADRIKKENERLQKERDRLKEQAQVERIAQENRMREEANQLRFQQEQENAARKAEADELERLRKQKAKQDRINQEKAEAQARDAELLRKQKEAAAAVAAKEKADRAKHTHALEQPQSFFPMDLKPSAPPMEDETVTPEKAARDKKNAARRKQAEAVRNFKKATAQSGNAENVEQECQTCKQKAKPKSAACTRCKKNMPNICITCYEKQKGECNECWNEVGQYTQKEPGTCDICYEEKEVRPLPCKTCKKSESRYCTTCLKAWGKCTFCHQPFDAKLID